MLYTCWLKNETFMRANTSSNASGAHKANDREMQAGSDSFTSSFLLAHSLSEPQRVVVSALHLVLMSQGFMFGIPSSLSTLHPSLQPPTAPLRHGPLDPAPLMCQQDIPGVSALSLIISWLLLHLHQTSDRPPTWHSSPHKQTHLKGSNIVSILWIWTLVPKIIYLLTRKLETTWQQLSSKISFRILRAKIFSASPLHWLISCVFIQVKKHKKRLYMIKIVLNVLQMISFDKSWNFVSFRAFVKAEQKFNSASTHTPLYCH